MKWKKILFVFISLIFSINFKVFAFGNNSDEIIEYKGFFYPVGISSFVFYDPALKRNITFYNVVQFNKDSTVDYVTIDGKKIKNPYNNHKAYYERIGRPYFFYQQYGEFGWYSPWVENYNLSKSTLLNIDLKKYTPNPGVILENTDNDIGHDRTGLAYKINGKVYNNIKKSGVDPDGASTDYIPAQFKIKYAPYNDNNSKQLVGKMAEFRYMGYSEFGTIVNNPYFPADIPSSYSYITYPWDNPVRYTFNFPTLYDLSKNKKIKQELIKYYLLRNAKTGQFTQFYTKISGTEQQKAEYWDDRLLLGGHPGLTSGVWAGTRDNGNKYRTFSTPGLDKPNLRLISMVLFDSNKNRVGEYYIDWYKTPIVVTKGNPIENLNPLPTKLKVGEEYELVVNVRNMYKEETKTKMKKLKVYTLFDNQAKVVTLYLEENSNYQMIDNGNTGIPGNTTEVFRGKIKIDKPVQRVRLVSVIPEIYYKNGDNFILDDDIGHLVFDVQPNDLEMQSVEFLDENNNVVTIPVINRKYKVKFNIKYNGATINNPVTFGIDNLKILDKDNRKLNSINQIKITDKLINGKVYSIISSESYFISKPYLYAEGYASAFNNNSIYNGDNTNDKGTHKIQANENLSVKITKVTPSYLNINSSKYQTFQVEYYIDYEYPIEQYITTKVDFKMSSSYTFPSVNSKTQNITIKTGKNGPYTFTTDNIYLYYNSSNNYNVNFEITVNPNKNAPSNESNWIDNKDTISSKIMSISNAKNPCNINTKVNTYNYWTQKFQLYKWKGHWDKYDCSYWECTSYGYDSKTNSYYCKSYRYVKQMCDICITDKTWYEYTSSSIYERYEIERIMFKSKQTNGWVDLKNTVGKIKAGYGFELEIYLRYETNRAWSEPVSWSSCESGQSVYPTYTPVYMPTNIYVILPDGQILSNNSSQNYKQLIEIKSTSGSWDNRLVIFRIKSGNTFGVKDTNKLYIDENTKDGYYNMTICNDVFDGHPLQWGSTLGKKEKLFDKQTVTIQVLGGYTDDIKLHIVQ